jgi:hypothetical protein
MKHCIRSEDQSYVSPTEIINLAESSKNPFLFMAASIIRLQRYHISGELKQIDEIPITSSSAYQIMSFFLLDEDLAQRTNLIKGDGETIQDLYTSLIEPLSAFLKSDLKTPLGEVVASRLTRKLRKKVYMPFLGLR